METEIRPKTILLVEDETDVSKVISKTLVKNGYNVITEKSGESAVDTAIENDSINLILMDIELGSGIEGTEAARRILARIEVPIVFHTSHPGRDIVEKVKGIKHYGYVIKTSENFVLLSSIEMALELFEANKKIAKSEKLFRGIFENSLSAIALVKLIYDENGVIKDGRVLSINKLCEKFIGLSSENVVGKLYSEVNPAFLKSNNLQRVIEAFSKGEPFINEGFFETAQKYFYFIAHEIDKGLVSITISDTTAQVLARKTLIDNEVKLKSYHLLHQVTDTIPACIACVNAEDLSYEFVNEIYSVTFGISSDKLVGKPVREVIGENAYNYAFQYIERALNGEKTSHENNINTLNGPRFFKVDYIPQLDENRNVKHIIVLAIDISDRKIADEKIQKLLIEKEILIREVHHRIKNNMSTISGILFLQSDSMKDESAIAALNDAQSRVHSMMVLYDKLYRSDSFIEMSITDYLPPLIDEIICSFPEITKIKIEKNIEPFIIDSTLLFPLGIIVNELITNIMKYAFIGRDSGIITISASTKNNNAVIVIEDNGTGLPESVDIKNSTGFGLCLVGILTEQLKGNINIERCNGTRFILEFEV